MAQTCDPEAGLPAPPDEVYASWAMISRTLDTMDLSYRAGSVIVIPKGFSSAARRTTVSGQPRSTARLVTKFGVRKLYLVNPKVDMSVATIYASHAADVLENAEVVTFPQLRKRNDMLVATTAVRARKKSNVIRRSVRPEQVSGYVRSARSASLVLGRSTTGLTNEEIRSCDVTTVVDTGSRYRTLNISHAAAILLLPISPMFFTLWGGILEATARPSRFLAKSSRAFLDEL